MSESASLAPLVSIIAISYKNFEHMYNCLDSILSQSYGNIELVVSNDGSDDFDEGAISSYIESKRTHNIKNVIINKNEQNLGTVKHCNVALGLSGGDYIMFIACDDMYNNADAVKDMANGFNTVPPDVMAIAGQTGMYNHDMTKCLELFVSEETQRLINELPPEELYREHLVCKCLLPAASMIYRREAFEKYGKFIEKYFLIEDWPYSVFSTKQGMRYYYLDIMCINHRDGGVSHSKFNRKSYAHKMYLKDYDLIIGDILEDTSLGEAALQKIRHNLMYFKEQYYVVFKMPLLISIFTRLTKKNILLIALISLIFAASAFYLNYTLAPEHLVTIGTVLPWLGVLGFFLSCLAVFVKATVKLIIHFKFKKSC